MKMLCCHRLFAEQYKGYRRTIAYPYMLKGYLRQVHIYSVAHKQHKEYVYKGLSAGKAVGIMESVPYKVQRINGKAYKKYKKQCTVNRLFLNAYALCEYIYYKEHEHGHAAVYIGPVIKPLLCLNIYHMPCKHIYYGKISAEGLREIY